MIKGSCLCGKVQYEIKHLNGPLVHCHCSYCKKAHSAAFSSNMSGLKDDFHLISGKEYLKSYEAKDELTKHKKRYFCSNCGSTMWHVKASKPDSMTFKMGCIDKFPDFDKNKVEGFHIYTRCDKPWLEYEGIEKFKDVKE